jgi:hypothetical protein
MPVANVTFTSNPTALIYRGDVVSVIISFISKISHRCVALLVGNNCFCADSCSGLVLLFSLVRYYSFIFGQTNPDYLRIPGVILDAQCAKRRRNVLRELALEALSAATSEVGSVAASEALSFRNRIERILK